MRYLIYSVIALGVVLVGYMGVFLGVPAVLASGEAQMADAPDFAVDEGWVFRPPARPSAVWEEGWALDFVLLPQVPDTLDRHGTVSSAEEAIRQSLVERNGEIAGLLGQFGAVYMPALRLPTQSTPDPDWTITRGDLVAALDAYFDNDNRGRAVAFYTEEVPPALLMDLRAALEAAGADGANDRIVLFVHPSGVEPNFSSINFPNASPLALNLEPRASWKRVFLLPNQSTRWTLPADKALLEADLQVAVDGALERARSNARKTVEPFGGFEIVREAPINRPCEAGLRCRRD